MSGTEANGGERVLLALIWPLCAEDMTPRQAEAFREAVEAQNAYAGQKKPLAQNIASEAVGDVRITYRDDRDGLAVNGLAVSPEAAAILVRAGLMTRWV